MKFKLMKTILLPIVMCVSSFANAGLILGSQEFLDLGATTGKTQLQVEAMIAGDNSLAGYVLATNVDMANIWQSLPYMQDSVTGWRGLSSNTQTVSEILEWLYVGTQSYDYGSTSTGSTPDGNRTFNTQSYGQLFYKNKDTNIINSGVFNVLYDHGTPTMILNRELNGNFNLANMDTTSGHTWSQQGSKHSLFVRATTVPEPSTLAIFALGMMGLASRRFKKQS
jgi:hypothetical protein